MSHVFTVKADTLRGLLKVAATKDVRYYLCGVYVDPANGCLVATDGHAMLLAKQEFESKLAPFVIPSKLIKSVLKHTKISASAVLVSVTDVEGSQWRQIRLDACKGFEIGSEIEGRYPDYRRVVPEKLSGKDAHYDPLQFAVLQEGISLVRGQSSTQPVEIIRNGNGPAVVAGMSDEGFGILMPMRSLSDDGTYCHAALANLGFTSKGKSVNKAVAPAEVAA